MCGYGHNGTSAVATKHVVGHKHRNNLSVCRVGRSYPLKAYARLLLSGIKAVLLIALRGLFHVGRNFNPVGDVRLVLREERVLGGEYEVGGTVERIGPCGKHRDCFAG